MRNYDREDAPKHLFIENPITGKSVNILPILKLSETSPFDGIRKGKESVYQALDDAIRLIATSKTDENLVFDYKMVLFCLYKLRDAFGNMVELKSKNVRDGKF